MIKTKIHIKIAETRTTQKKVSEDTGIRLATLSNYCTDKYITISKKHIDLLCKYFKCQPSDLFEYVED
jgi:putative transcriptional regulator